MADFAALLAEQKRTSDILSKQRNPLDARTGAGKALLDQQKSTNEKLDRIAEINNTSLLEDNLSNLAEIFNAQLIRKQEEGFQKEEKIVDTDDILGSKTKKSIQDLTIEKNKADTEYQTKSLSLFERMAGDMSGRGAGQKREGDTDQILVGFMKGEISKLRKDGKDDGDSRAGPGIFGKAVNSIKSLFGKSKKDEDDNDKKRDGLLKKMGSSITKGFMGLAGSLKTAGKGLFVTGLTVLALAGLLKFLRSDYWKELQERLIPALTEGFRMLGEGIDATIKFFDPEGEHFGLKITGALIAGLAVLFAGPALIAGVTAAIVGLFKSFTGGKLGQLLTGVDKKGQVLDKDGKPMPKDSKISGMKNTAKSVARRFGPVAAAFGIYDAATTIMDDDLSKAQKIESVSGTVGGTGGALAGAAAGAAIGSVVPIFGTAVGGLVGGLAGYFAGEKGGEAIGQKIAKVVGNDLKTKDIAKSRTLTRGEREKLKDSQVSGSPVIVNNTNNSQTHTQSVSYNKPLTQDGFIGDLSSSYQ